MAKKLDFDDYKLSNMRHAVTTVSGAYVASLVDYVIISSGTSITLPDASLSTGRLYIIKSTGGDIALGGITVLGGTCKHVVSDGTTWVDITPG